jgi:hypothetical protein
VRAERDQSPCLLLMAQSAAPGDGVHEHALGQANHEGVLLGCPDPVRPAHLHQPQIKTSVFSFLPQNDLTSCRRMYGMVGSF